MNVNELIITYYRTDSENVEDKKNKIIEDTLNELNEEYRKKIEEIEKERINKEKEINENKDKTILRLILDENNLKMPKCLENSDDLFSINDFTDNIEFVSFYDKYLKNEKYYIENIELLFDENSDLNKILKKIISVIEVLSKNKIFVYLLNPADIYIINNNKIFLKFADFERNYTEKPIKLDNNLRQNKNDLLFLHKTIRNSFNISYKELNENLTNYSFSYFLLKLIAPVDKFETKSFKKYVENISLFNENISPYCENYFSELLFNDKSGETPLNIFQKFINSVKKIFTKKEKYNDLSISFGFHQESGRRKGKNEDVVYGENFNNEKGLLMFVGDGVSTCDIGSGRQASATVFDYFENNRKILKDLFDELSNNNGDFEKITRKKIKTMLNQIQDEVILKIKNLIKKDNLNATEETHLMSTTITMGIFLGNYGIIAHLGDSPCFLLRNNELVNIIKPDNAEMESIFLGDYKEGSELTKVIPMYELKNGEVEEKALDELITYKLIYLQKGDMILMSSDGLTDCLEEDEIFETIKKYRTENMNDIAFNLTKKANEEKGIDNISVCIATFE